MLFVLSWVQTVGEERVPAVRNDSCLFVLNADAQTTLCGINSMTLKGQEKSCQPRLSLQEPLPPKKSFCESMNRQVVWHQCSGRAAVSPLPRCGMQIFTITHHSRHFFVDLLFSWLCIHAGLMCLLNALATSCCFGMPGLAWNMQWVRWPFHWALF